MVPGTERDTGMVLVDNLMAGSVCGTCRIQNTELWKRMEKSARRKQEAGPYLGMLFFFFF